MLALVLAGCSTSSSLLDSFSTTKKTDAAAATQPAAGTTTGAAANAAVGPGGVALDDFECPGVQIRSGAATLMITDKAASGEPNALDLKYQGTITRTARECKLVAGTVTMKIGIEGRIITGPVGGPGQIEVPIRMAVVHEGPDPKTVVSKLYRIPVTIGSADGNGAFTEIDPDVAFPMPHPAGAIDAYVVYVGFDPLANQPQKNKPKPARKPRVSTRKPG
ncbi:MAG TPA: hypothetical protein VHD14_15780 [Pseudolabrys sp.]|nr:hypothetical protein [Pseudolabrys sp.]